MKAGKTLEQLAAEVVRQRDVKRDFIAPSNMLVMLPSDGNVVLHLDNNEFDINDLAHRQLGEYAGVPARYYDRMLKEAPELLTRNLNHWLSLTDERRMVRTLDGRMRALLSDRFRTLDNYDLAEAVLPPLQAMGVQVLSSEVTERRMYIKAIDGKVSRELALQGKQMGKGHDRFETLCPAIVISNSEVGAGALMIETAVWTTGCTNLCILSQRSMRKYHVGAKQDIGEQVYAMLSDTTKKLTDAALWAQTRDVVIAAFDEARFDAHLNTIAKTAEDKITGDVPKVVEIVTKKLGATEEEGKSFLRHLIQGGDLTRYGLFNAVTRAAEDVESYDRATEMERMGGEIIELARNDWEEIAAAA